ncbi:unnamed protein product [Rhizophagus irregularis]|nr:unnamed protein product [Rhizophagus irregularis]
METTGSGRLDNGNQNEPVPGYRFNILKVKGTEKTKGKGSMTPWTYQSSIFRSISKVFTSFYFSIEHLIHE